MKFLLALHAATLPYSHYPFNNILPINFFDVFLPQPVDMCLAQLQLLADPLIRPSQSIVVPDDDAQTPVRDRVHDHFKFFHPPP